MLKALHYCHKVVKVIHRDIKPDNIVLNHNNEAVLIDFGVCAIVDDQEDDALDSNNGSWMFWAPEMFHKKKGETVRGEKTDIWALGVTFFYIITGKYPCHHVTNYLQLIDALQKEFDFECIKCDDVKSVLMQMLDKDPEKRSTIDQILQSDWITKKGTKQINLNEIKDDELEKTGKSFGNIKRLIKSKALGHGSTVK